MSKKQDNELYDETWLTNGQREMTHDELREAQDGVKTYLMGFAFMAMVGIVLYVFIEWVKN